MFRHFITSTLLVALSFLGSSSVFAQTDESADADSVLCFTVLHIIDDVPECQGFWFSHEKNILVEFSSSRNDRKGFGKMYVDNQTLQFKWKQEKNGAPYNISFSEKKYNKVYNKELRTFVFDDDDTAQAFGAVFTHRHDYDFMTEVRIFKLEYPDRAIPDSIFALLDEEQPVAEPDPVVAEEVYDNAIVDVPAQFPGGEKALLDTIAANLKYPEAALQAKLEGVVLLKVTINTNGEIEHIKVLLPLSQECLMEAVRVLRSLPRFIPAQHEGRPVPVMFTIPVKFTLPKQ